MNTLLESIVAAFGILLWMITGTITYWLICNADDKATCETNTAGDNSKVWQNQERLSDTSAANERSEISTGKAARNGRDVPPGIQRYRSV